MPYLARSPFCHFQLVPPSKMTSLYAQHTLLVQATLTSGRFLQPPHWSPQWNSWPPCNLLLHSSDSDPCVCSIFWLRNNTHPVKGIKYTRFKCTTTFFNIHILTLIYKHHPDQDTFYFLHSVRFLNAPTQSISPQESMAMLSTLISFVFSRTWYKWNMTVHKMLCLFSLVILYQRFIRFVACASSSFLWLCNIPFN